VQPSPPKALALQPKSVFDVLDLRSGVAFPFYARQLYSHDVEAVRLRAVTPTGQRHVGCRRDLSLLSPIDRSRGRCKRVRAAGFDFDEGNRPVLLGDEIDLTTRRSPTSRQNLIAVTLQVFGSKPLAALAERLTGVSQRSISKPSAPSSIGP